ncbi:MAG: PepSY domain-containing protein [Sphingomonadales bacterium]|nr:PepSY domain-containing protein [Sphingomonadales bacterium]MDE2169844.1 PepSY domain-containing protein [Sphingomonadales bacterium]
MSAQVPNAKEAASKAGQQHLPAKPPFRLLIRRWHRWCSITAVILLAWVTITGTMLGMEYYLTAPPRSAAAPNAARDDLSPLGGNLSQRLEDLTSRLTALSSRAPVVELQIDLRGAGTTGRGSAFLHSADGRQTHWSILGDQLVPRAATASAMPTPEQIRLHNLLIALHCGSIIGLPGRLLDCLAGLAFVFLGASGLWLYIDMYRMRQHRGGGRQLFWNE